MSRPTDIVYVPGMPDSAHVCRTCGGRGWMRTDAEQGALLKQDRLHVHLTLTYVAGAMGFSASYIHDLEAGRRAWNADLRGRYVDALGGKQYAPRT